MIVTFWNLSEYAQLVSHVNVVMAAYRSLCGLLLEHRSLESEGLTLDSSWGLRIFSHCSTFITRPRHFSFLSNRVLLIHVLFFSGEAHSEICDVVRTV